MFPPFISAKDLAFSYDYIAFETASVSLF